MIYKITKIGSTKHPKVLESNFGESMPFHLGICVKKPTIGERFNLLPINKEYGRRGISTSQVTKIIDENIFETIYSIYKLEKYTENL